MSDDIFLCETVGMMSKSFEVFLNFFFHKLRSYQLFRDNKKNLKNEKEARRGGEERKLAL